LDDCLHSERTADSYGGSLTHTDDRDRDRDRDRDPDP
jgi:hypothetical protein